MSLRLNVYGIDLAPLLAAFPGPRAAVEGDEELAEVHRAAEAQGLAEIDLDGWKAQGLGALAERFPSLWREGGEFAWLITGRPLRGESFPEYGWTYYAYLTRAEMRALAGELADLAKGLKPPADLPLPAAPAALAARAAAVRSEAEAEALFAELPRYADAQKLVYAAMTALLDATGAYPRGSSVLLQALRVRDDPDAGVRQFMEVIQGWLAAAEAAGKDLWVLAD